MRKPILFLGISSLMFFCSCGKIAPGPNDILGNWTSPEKTTFAFNGNGTFIGGSIPTGFAFIPTDSLKEKEFNGSGKWMLKEENGGWEVLLDFDKVSIDKNGCEFPLLLSGENGVLGNKPPWYLFLWKGEEGGERIRFTKK